MKKIIETTIRRFIADFDFQPNMASETAIHSLTEMIDDAVRDYVEYDDKMLQDIQKYLSENHEVLLSVDEMLGIYNIINKNRKNERL